MSKFTIEWLERKETSTGKTKYDVTLNGENGSIDPVTIWSDFPDFANLKPGSEVEGKISSKPFKGKIYYTLNSENTVRTFTPKPSTIAKAQEVKRQDIAVAQIHKEASIKVSSTARDATQILVALMNQDSAITSENWQENWKAIREWLWLNFDAKETDFPPF